MRIAINGNRHQEGHLEEIDRLVSHIIRQNHDVVMAEPFLRYLESNLGERFGAGIDYVPLTSAPNADLAISIGGDGAFLKTARWIGEAETPVAGINTGHLGYLSAFTFENADEIYSQLLTGDFRIENRSVLCVGIIKNGVLQPTRLTALNEVAITRGDNSSMLRIAARIDNRSSLNYMGDGLIISTPTGSTAYNLSVGGPVLDPELAGWVLSPIAAHSLSMRPLVVKDSSVIEISVETRAEVFRVSADGKPVTLGVADRLIISKAPHSVKLVQQPHHAFADTLREKLGMGTTLV
ncbi:MAG: NAD(+)/NADH kinase [Muribaculaceae bacterium]|nr:NAD(+)/NADH kinase [Muribaculaceae bacterium]